MADVNGKTVAIYATKENAAIMDRAKSVGVNVSKVCNDLWDKYLPEALEHEVELRTKELKSLLKSL